MTARNIIKQWFSNGKKPTEEQFWEWLDSFFHKHDKIPQSSVEGLTDGLNNKLDTPAFETHLDDPKAHNFEGLLKGKADKKDLEELSKDIVPQVQANWNEYDSSSKAFIENKPGLREITEISAQTKVGTAIEPPLIIPSGVLTTVPVNGAIENDGTYMYITLNGNRLPVVDANIYELTISGSKTIYIEPDAELKKGVQESIGFLQQQERRWFTSTNRRILFSFDLEVDKYLNRYAIANKILVKLKSTNEGFEKVFCIAEINKALIPRNSSYPINIEVYLGRYVSQLALVITHDTYVFDDFNNYVKKETRVNQHLGFNSNHNFYNIEFNMEVIIDYDIVEIPETSSQPISMVMRKGIAKQIK